MEVEAYLHAFVTSAQVEMSFQLLASDFLFLRKAVGTHWLGRWVDCKTRLGAAGERKVSCPDSKRILVLRSYQPVA
jgi:hypothetical protein